MSGALPDWSFARAWRRDSHLGDKLNDSVPLTGGWYTDGGHLKSSLTIASSASLMAFAALTWEDSIRTINTTPDVGDRNDTAAWDQLLRNLDWAADYLHRCATAGGSGTFVAQVGDHYTEDSYWGAPEDEPASTFRPIWVVRDSNREGADVVSQAVAALTGVGLLLQRSSPGRWPAERAQRYLDKADELWAWGQNLDSVWQAPEGNITVTGYTYSDDKAWAAAWLCKRAILTNGTNAEAVCNEAADMWGDYIMREGVLTTDNWAAAALLLLRDTGAGGLTERYMAGLRGPAMAFVALAAAEDPADPAEARRWQCWAKGQVDWLLGNNPAKQALVTGLEDAPGFSGITVPEQPHHRGSACMGGVCAPRGQPNPRPLPGALLAGPQRDGTVADSRDNGPYSFVSIEYNAAFAAALMGN
ncbi:hypothetical protein GPECTOR_16g679 [Gonium pectorale]|uniref:cellulase n=1 Tax=Gonium pectorale TaxID=33097 RepID=A0A150GL35_GONPE|nr:hypothetical protein GPECTOR_16g679 [Gonium pectorale]|eukprot:KXZ50504.1 hypothetical protein GPECTOR_16g679 [Gonium pectorale]